MLRPLWILVLLGWGMTPQEAKLPVPTEKAQAEAEKTIRDIFKEEFAVKTSTAQQKLAKKLIEQGRETRDDPAARFVLFREAADLATHAGDIDLLLLALKDLCDFYRVDPATTMEPFLTRAEPTTTKPEDLKRLAETLAELARGAAELEQFEAASKMAQASLAAAKRSKDLSLTVKTDTLVKSVSDLRNASEKARKAEQTLLSTPNDPQANQALGEHLCLAKGQWEKGLPHLSRGSDPVLKSLASRELAAPTETAAQIDIGDGWWNLKEKETNITRKYLLLVHAETLYEAALPATTGLIRAKLEKRIAEGVAAGHLPGTPPRVNRIGLLVWWKCDEGKGTTVANSAGSGNEATLMNGVEWIPGRLGKALRFDGKSGYLSGKPEHLPATHAPQTISFWLNLSSRSTRGEDLLCFSNDPLTGALQAGVSTSKLSFWKFGGGLLASATAPTVEEWHHCAFVSDGKTHSVYLDGKMENSTSNPSQAVPVTNCEFGRYRGLGGESHYFSGALDDIRIYNRALTEPEVRGLATGTE
ncbi:MAG TPA: LamG domain-containing protein [Planctomycetota bacterium]|nr:LamG domain-containing protein [Planctomycetota bacterium]